MQRVEDRRRAATDVGGVAEPAARARVHRRDELERGRKRERPAAARDGYAPLFEGLAQRLEHVPAVLRQLVQEEDAAMRETGFTGTQPARAPSADEARDRG